MRDIFIQKISKTALPKLGKRRLSLPGMIFGSVIISTVIAMTSQASHPTTINIIEEKSQYSKLDSAISSRIEEIREVAFNHLCTQGCYNNENTSELKYDLTNLKPLCMNKELGKSLLAELKTEKFNLADDFNLNEYDNSAQSTLISSKISTSENQLVFTFSEREANIKVITSITPHSVAWCP